MNNLPFTLAMVLVWAATALYCYLASRQQRRRQETWDQFSLTHADLDQELDLVLEVLDI